MKRKIVFFIVLLFLSACESIEKKAAYEQIDADELVEHIDAYVGKPIAVEGKIVHVCAVDGFKMKLHTPKGEILKIVPADSSIRFDKSFNNKLVQVIGIANETRISKTQIDQLEQEKTLLCHIDYTPCKDSLWVQRQFENGNAEDLAKRDIANLRLKSADKNYVSQITIEATAIKMKE
ncbi:MAG: hypothetical protein LBM67_06060 [Lentimicrobiaceae bacterium]|jgi:hypothetical protein|nr:hypothetical protein [Lentimicrobiaceae bacterium]